MFAGKVSEAPGPGGMNLFSVEKSSFEEERRKREIIQYFAHQFVPKHELLSKKDAEELMHEFHIRPHQLPYIKTNDPAAETLGAKMGDILRITRKSATAGEVIVYRYVVD